MANENPNRPGFKYLVIGPQVYWNGFLGRRVNRTLKVECPYEVHRIQHLDSIGE